MHFFYSRVYQKKVVPPPVAQMPQPSPPLGEATGGVLS
jgi:hypothetical protein